MSAWIYNPDEDSISPARGRRRGTDAGTAAHTGEPFVVEAPSADAAFDMARRWIACWADEDQDCVPDDLGLVEHRGYVALGTT